MKLTKLSKIVKTKKLDGRRLKKFENATYFDVKGNEIGNEKFAVGLACHNKYYIRMSHVNNSPIDPRYIDPNIEFSVVPQWEPVHEETFNKYISFLKTRQEELYESVIAKISGYNLRK
jgi:hypothetical protein